MSLNAQERFKSYISTVRGDDILEEEEELQDDSILPISLNPEQEDFFQQKQREQQDSSIIPVDIREPQLEDQNIMSFDSVPSSAYQYTLDDLEKDSEFQFRAERFLEENGWWYDKSIFEYLRDSEWSLSSAMSRSSEMENWSDQSKQDYTYLKNKFDNADVGGLKQTLNMIGDLTVDMVADPINFIAALATPLTLGTSTAAAATVKQLATQGLNKQIISKASKEALKAAKRPAIYTGLEGAGWAGAHDYFLQDGETELGLRDEINLTQSAVVAGFGGLMGGAVGGIIGVGTTLSPLLKRKQYGAGDGKGTGVSDEISIRKQAQQEEAPIILKETKEEFEFEQLAKRKEKEITGTKAEQEDSKYKRFYKFLSLTIGKPTTEFMLDAKKSKDLSNFLDGVRPDWYRKIFDTERKLETESFSEIRNGLVGTWLEKNKNAYVGLTEVPSGFLGLSKKLDANENQQILQIIENIATGPVSPTVQKAGLGLVDLYQDIFEALTFTGKYQAKALVDDKGKYILDNGHRTAINAQGYRYQSILPVSAKVEDYFPYKIQRDKLVEKEDLWLDASKRFGFKKTKIEEGYPEFDFFNSYAAPNNEIPNSATKQFVNEFGDLQQGYESNTKTVDEYLFGEGTDFIKEAKERFNPEIHQEFIEQARISLEQPGPKQLFVEDDLQKRAELALATDLKARKLHQRLIEVKHSPFEAYFATDSANHIRGTNSGWIKPRVLSNMPAEIMNEFIDTDVRSVTTDYILSASNLIAREQVFGRNIYEFEKRFANRIFDDLGRGDYAKKTVDNLKRFYERTTGIDQSTAIGTGKARTTFDYLKLSQQLAHLPLATLSSITEPLILLSRIEAADTPEATKVLGQALWSQGKRSIRQAKELFERKTKGSSIVGDTDAEFWHEAYQVGLAFEQASVDRLGGLFGDFVGDSYAQKTSRAFFKATFLQQWTAAVQLASFTSGKRLIIDKLERLSKGNLDNTLRKRYEDQLNELGIDIKEGLSFYNRNLKDGNFNIDSAYKDAFYQNEYLKGAGRFAREIILNPDITEANKPLWFSDPTYNILVQFAGYPTVFNNTILKRFAGDVVRDFKDGRYESAPKIVAATSLMTAVATLTNAGRTQGKSLEKEGSEILKDSIERWGGLGPFQYADNLLANFKVGGGQFGSLVKAPSGPLVQDFVDGILYRKGIAEVLATNVPLYSLLPFEYRQSLKKSTRDLDKFIESPFVSPAQKRFSNYISRFPSSRGRKKQSISRYAKGGEVGRYFYAEGGPVKTEKDLEVYNYITRGLRKQSPIFEDRRPTTKYTEKELKDYAKGITVPVYRYLPKDTRRADLEQFRDAESIGVDLFPNKIRKGVKGYVRLHRPLDLRGLSVRSMQGHSFVSNIKDDKILQDKIINDSILPDKTAKQYIDNLIMKHDLTKQVIEDSVNKKELNKLLNIKASHEIRETLSDIGYDGIIYNKEERQEFFAGSLVGKASRNFIKIFNRGQFRPLTKQESEEYLEAIKKLKEQIENDPETLYVYPDTEARGGDVSIGGVEQFSSAKAGRGLPNALGIAIKRKNPTVTGKKYNTERIYFEDKIRGASVIDKNLKNPKKDIAKIIESFVEGGYKKLKISPQLLNAISSQSEANSNAPMTVGVLRNLINNLEQWSKTGPAPENLNAGYMQVLGPSFVPTRQVDPYYKTKEATSKVALPNVVMDRPRVRTQPMETTKVLEPEEIDFRTKEKVKQLEEELNDPAVRAALPANKFRSFQEEIFDPDPELVYAEQALEEIDRLKAKDYLEPYERMGDITPKSQVDLLYDQYERLLDEGRGTEADELMDRIRRLEGN